MTQLISSTVKNFIPSEVIVKLFKHEQVCFVFVFNQYSARLLLQELVFLVSARRGRCRVGTSALHKSQCTTLYWNSHAYDQQATGRVPHKSRDYLRIERTE